MKAEQARRSNRPATAPQRRTIAYLAGTAEMEIPEVRWRREATRVIDFLEAYVRQPTLPLQALSQGGE
jgi:hypothetical protein